MWDARLLQKASTLLEICRQKNIRLVTAESCTGGLLAALLTEISGASDVFLGGWVTYANDLKNRHLDVPADMLDQHGAVSAPVAAAMATGALHAVAHYPEAQRALAITGIAGPNGGNAEKPVGLVYIALATSHSDTPPQVARHVLSGSRSNIRLRAVDAALTLLQESLG